MAKGLRAPLLICMCIVALYSCGNTDAPAGSAASGYPSADSLQKALSGVWAEFPAELHLQSGEKSEVLKRTVNPLKDLDFLSDQSLHKPFYKGMFTTSVSGDTLVLLSKKPDKTGIVRQTWIYNSAGQLKAVSGESFKKNFLYSTGSEFSFELENGKPYRHLLSGYQKIIFFDTTHYRARVQYWAQ